MKQAIPAIGIVAAALEATACSSRPGSSYGDDRARVGDLEARYLFAMDFGDADSYAGTLAPDGILDFGQAHGDAYWTHMISGKDGRGTVDFFGHRRVSARC